MKLEEAKKMLEKFADRRPNITTRKVAVKNGFAYATDGRVGIKVKIDGECADEVPDSYPIDKLDRIIEDAFSNDAKWYRLKPCCYESMREKCMTLVREEKARNMMERMSRYKEMRCPRCGGELYYDTEEDGLLENIEEIQDVLPHDVEMSVRLEMGDEWLPMAFGYILEIVYGVCTAGFDVVFAKEDVGGKDAERPKMLFKSSDGDLIGVCMPLFVHDGEFVSQFGTLETYDATLDGPAKKGE